MNFLDNGVPKGLVVDLVQAAARFMQRRVEIRLMNWAQAQQLVLDGKADALIQINPNPERRKLFDFSSPLLESDFAIFTSGQRVDIDTLPDLRGKKVGVEKEGQPSSLVDRDPRITAVQIPSLETGLRMLVAGSVDAVIADRRVGMYLLAVHAIRGVRVVGRPVETSQSAIAVRKGNDPLLDDINHGLAEIRRDGTYDQILHAWTPKEVVYLTREQQRRQWVLLSAITVLLMLSLAGILALVLEVRRRRRAEAKLDSVVQQLEASLNEIKTLRGIVPICARCKRIRDDQGFWTQVEAYISQRTEAEFSHGLCPDCLKTLYPEFVDPAKKE
jgi:ABC-type amino acid transport substrate-binding protein